LIKTYIMKAIKLTIAALLLACTFQAASAQVRVGVGVNIGNPYPVYERSIVYERPVVYGRPVVYERPVYRRHIYRRYAYRPMVRERVIVRNHRRW